MEKQEWIGILDREPRQRFKTETKGNLDYRSWAVSRWLSQKFCKTYFPEIEYDTKIVFNNSSDI